MLNTFEQMAQNLKIPGFFLHIFVIKDPLKKLEANNQISTSTTFLGNVVVPI